MYQLEIFGVGNTKGHSEYSMKQSFPVVSTISLLASAFMEKIKLPRIVELIPSTKLQSCENPLGIDLFD